MVTKMKYLVCVDNSEDWEKALKFSCFSIKNNGGKLALMHVIEPADFMHWQGVESIMKDEARKSAEELLSSIGSNVGDQFGLLPEFIVKEGDKVEEIISVANSEANIDIIVLGSAAPGKGSNRLVTELTAKLSNGLNVLLTIVPANLSDESLEKII